MASNSRVLDGTAITSGSPSNILSLPATTDTLVGRATTDTLTNKTWNGNAIGAAYGGTGLTSITSGSVLVGNGTSAASLVAPGSSGNVLTSTGSLWQSSSLQGNSTALKAPTHRSIAPRVSFNNSCLPCVFASGLAKPLARNSGCKDGGVASEAEKAPSKTTGDFKELLELAFALALGRRCLVERSSLGQGEGRPNFNGCPMADTWDEG